MVTPPGPAPEVRDAAGVIEAPVLIVMPAALLALLLRTGSEHP